MSSLLIFNRVYRLTSLVHLSRYSPPSKSQCTTLYIIYRQCVAGGRVLSCVGDHILQEFNTLFLTKFRTYKIARPPQTRTPRTGGGLGQIKTCRKVSLQVNFLDNDIWHCFLSVYSFYGIHPPPPPCLSEYRLYCTFYRH